MIETLEAKKRGRPRGKNLLNFNVPVPPAGDGQVESSEAPPADESFDFAAPYQSFGAEHAGAFQRFTETYPDRRGISVYVWRLDPPIDRKQIGISETNIEIIPGAVDLEALLEKHGSGEYHLKFNDANAKPAQRAKCTVRLDDPGRPANLNPAELLLGGTKGARNAALVAKYVGLGWSVADKKNELMPEGFRGLDPPPAAPAVAEKSAGVDKALVDLVRETVARSQNQGSEIDRAFQIFDRLKPADSKPADPVEQFVRMAELFRSMQPAPAPPPAAVDPMEQVKKMSEFFSTMGWTAPGGGGGSESGGIRWGDVIGALPGLFQHGASFLSQLMAYRAMTAPAPAGGVGVALAPVLVPVLPIVPSVPSVSEGEEMLNPVKLAALLEVGRMALVSIETAESGDDFAEKLCESAEYGALYDDLVDMGKAGIIATLGAIPGMNDKLAPRRAEMEIWLDRFLAYDAGGPPAAAPAA